MIAINAAMANQLNEFKVSIDKLSMEEGAGKDEAIFRILKETIISPSLSASKAMATPNSGKEAARRGPDRHLPCPKP